jgi:hypothetical protein
MVRMAERTRAVRVEANLSSWQAPASPTALRRLFPVPGPCGSTRRTRRIRITHSGHFKELGPLKASPGSSEGFYTGLPPGGVGK